MTLLAWQKVYDETVRTHLTGCGHTCRGKRVWFRVKVNSEGAQVIHSVCVTCATERDYTTIDRDIVPRRTRVEYLSGHDQIRRLSDA